MAVFTALLIIISLHIHAFRGSPAIRYSASCSVPLCAIGNCSSRPLCYEFQTIANEPLCAPPVTCSLFDPCINGGTRCASNTSVCIVNSCCASPICMPLSLNFTCTNSQSTNTNAPISTSTIPSTIVTMTTDYWNCTWSPWANGLCSVTCGTGTYVRQRYCLDQFNQNCNNSNCASNSDVNGTRPCYYPACAPRK